MADYIKLSAAEKEEVRRLTQKANRRIKAFLKMYEQAGYKTIPKEVTSGLQVQSRQQFQTDKYAISRSVKFESRADFKKHMKMLKQFDPGRADSIPTVREYNKVQQKKILTAFETAGVDPSSDLKKRIAKMTAPDISKFWKDYGRMGQRKAMEYSSEGIMLELAKQYSKQDAAWGMMSVLARR